GTGALTAAPGSPFGTGTAPRSVIVHVSGKFAYVANGSDNTVSAYTITPPPARSQLGPAVPLRLGWPPSPSPSIRAENSRISRTTATILSPLILSTRIPGLSRP